MKKLLFLLSIVFFVSILFWSCNKNGSLTHPPTSKQESIERVRSKLYGEKILIGEGKINIPLENIQQVSSESSNAKDVCVGLTVSSAFFTYRIYWIPANCSVSGTDDYSIEFENWLSTSPNWGNISTPDPSLSNVVVKLNGVTLTGTQTSYGYPHPDNSLGYTILGNASLFSDLGVTCSNSTISVEISGTFTCSLGGTKNFTLTSNPSLHPSACPGYSPQAVIYPAESFNTGEFWLLFPWDITCHETCFLPSDWTQLEVQYYKSPSGSVNTTYLSYRPVGPYTITVSSGSGVYYVRARYNCSGGGTGIWSDWKPIQVY